MQRMFSTIVDAYSKWMDVVMMTSTTSENTINALRHLFSSYGLSVEIVSDNGPHFVSEEYEIFLKDNGVRHIRSAAYHPASNGEAERAVRTFKQAMNERGMYLTIHNIFIYLISTNVKPEILCNMKLYQHSHIY